MEVFSERRLAKDHADRIRKGYSAYAETDTLASLIKKNSKSVISASTKT